MVHAAAVSSSPQRWSKPDQPEARSSTPTENLHRVRFCVHCAAHTTARLGTRPQGSFGSPCLFWGRDVRTAIYVDGFNLYYSALKAERTLRWLDIRAMAQGALRPHNQIVLTRYFTAKVSATPSNAGAPNRQDAYLRALQAHVPNLTVHLGTFRTERRRRPLASPQPGGPATVEVLERCEKGSDVNLAVNLLNDAWADRFDCAVVVSNDSDLAEAIFLTRAHGKVVGILTARKRPTQELAQQASFYHRITRTHLTHSQLPDPVAGPNGPIHKPTGWT